MSSWDIAGLIIGSFLGCALFFEGRNSRDRLDTILSSTMAFVLFFAVGYCVAAASGAPQ